MSELAHKIATAILDIDQWELTQDQKFDRLYHTDSGLTLYFYCPSLDDGFLLFNKEFSDSEKKIIEGAYPSYQQECTRKINEASQKNLKKIYTDWERYFIKQDAPIGYVSTHDR